jgi:putative transposase
VAGYKRTAAVQGAFICFEDEAGQGLKPPRGRTWGKRGRTPVVKISNAGTKRVNLAGLIAFRPVPSPRVRLIHRSRVYHGWKNEPKGFDEHDYIRLLDAAHQQLRAPIVLVWDNLNTHKSALMRRLTAARQWLTVFYLPTTAPELNPVEGVWAVMKSGLVNLVKREIDQLRDNVKHRLRCMQHRPELLSGLLAKTGLDPRPP